MVTIRKDFFFPRVNTANQASLSNLIPMSLNSLSIFLSLTLVSFPARTLEPSLEPAGLAQKLTRSLSWRVACLDCNSPWGRNSQLPWWPREKQTNKVFAENMLRLQLLILIPWNTFSHSSWRLSFWTTLPLAQVSSTRSQTPRQSRKSQSLCWVQWLPSPTERSWVEKKEKTIKEKDIDQFLLTWDTLAKVCVLESLVPATLFMCMESESRIFTLLCLDSPKCSCFMSQMIIGSSNMVSISSMTSKVLSAWFTLSVHVAKEGAFPWYPGMERGFTFGKGIEIKY